MPSNSIHATVNFNGYKPLLFDRYMGNDAKLSPIDKVYWDKDGVLAIPQANIYSALASENTKSVAKMFYGKKAKTIGMAIQNTLLIKEVDIPVLKEGEKVLRDEFEKKFTVVKHTARLPKGIPNQKERPLLDDPWTMTFNIKFLPTSDLSWTVMQQVFEYAGYIGIGTFRPLYGCFNVEIN